MKTVTAKQIQSEILTAQEALLDEANKILSDAADVPAYNERLRAMGFSGSAAVSEKKLADAKAVTDLQDMYSFEYPGLKFIPASAMSSICKKYGLAVGHVSMYTGTVPEWALKQIEANRRHISEENYWERDLVFFNYAYRDGSSPWTNTVTGDTVLSKDKPTDTTSNLFIAAPKADMAIPSRGEVQEDGTIVFRTDDPIVCLSVKGGYIVLAAWGEEGSDPQVFNANNN